MPRSLRAHLRRIASRGGTAGRGASKRRGDSAYYARLARKRRKPKAEARAVDYLSEYETAQLETARQHRDADRACGRNWVCACAACRTVRHIGKPKGTTF